MRPRSVLVVVAATVAKALTTRGVRARGFVGLQNHSDADEVYFRLVEVTPGA